MVGPLLLILQRPFFLWNGLLFSWHAPIVNNLQLTSLFGQFNAHPFEIWPTNTCGGARNNFKVQRAGISNWSGSTCKPLFAKPHEILFTTVGRPHLLRRTSGVFSQSALPGFGWIFFKLNNFATSCHLQSGKIFNLSVLIVLAASETQMLCQILKVTFVKAAPLWLSNFPSLQNNSSSTRVYGWALLGKFSWPWHLWHFACWWMPNNIFGEDTCRVMPPSE